MRLSALALLLIAAFNAPAAAQGNPQTREGFWISFGVGFGSLGCDDCDERQGGTNGYLRMGGTLSQKLLIGGEVSGAGVANRSLYSPPALAYKFRPGSSSC